MRQLIQALARTSDLVIARRDHLVEQIPSDYEQSPVLPRLYAASIGRLLCFRSMTQRAASVSGDIVECGTSIGHGLLQLMLLEELAGRRRFFWSFDSYEGFPESTLADLKTDGTPQMRRGDYNTPIEIVHRVLAAGGVSDDARRNRLRIVKGYFERTLDQHSGQIALLHLDCDLHDSYTICLERLYDRVAPGGVILFDEYQNPNFPGARVAIDAFFADKPEQLAQHAEYGYTRYYVIKSRTGRTPPR